MRSRAGVTLIELLVALALTAVLGATLVRLLSSQSHFTTRLQGRSIARGVSESATALLVSDLRMVEAAGGVVAASPTSLTVRSPYALGVICENTSSSMTAALLPVDSMVLAEAGTSGYAWRDTTGVYGYVETGFTIGAGTPSICAAANVAVLPNGAVISISPGAPSGALPGNPLLLFQRIRYDFTASVSFPGTTALWRTVVASNRSEELAAPFDSTARFQFFVPGSIASQVAVPSPLSATRGIELFLTAVSARVTGVAERAPYTTAVFFKNR